MTRRKASKDLPVTLRVLTHRPYYHEFDPTIAQRCRELPASCPKCRAESPSWNTISLYGWCRLCGYDLYVASEMADV